MRHAGVLLVILTAVLRAQEGQSGPRPGWPCVPGRAVDASYVDIAETSGGQLFLFQKGEVGQAGPVVSASFTHPSTILRAVGQLAGSREFEFPVDAATGSILVMASLQCRSAIEVQRPSGVEMIAANSTQNVDLQTGRILRVDLPESGKWKVRLAGTGLFVLTVAAKTDIGLGSVRILENGKMLEAHVSGAVSHVRFHFIGPGGERLTNLEAGEPVEPETYRIAIVPPGQRFRIAVTGTDEMAVPFQRTWPNLFPPGGVK